ncbi:hypothetical protein VN0768_08920 [Helicobacter pylori]
MKDIYLDVKKGIKDLQKIFENTNGGNERLRESNQEALKEFKNLESESLKELESLKNNEEWEKFTIAFYGETGAGKSTLIECLRLFFKEPEISNATKKAHAIFYVTRTPAPPQKGEEGKERTIEKIQKQLDSQTEVYTLFNKPINSPRALKDGLIDENEKESLKILNEKMKAILGKHYEGHQIVSTQVAFYGLSSALLPETDFYKNKQKFLEIFKAEELLLKSHFKQLGEFIAGTLLENSRKKIIESNCNKALKVIEKLQKAITTTIDREINPTIEEIKNAQLETYSNLDRSGDKFVSNLRNLVSKEIERFKSDFRIGMHEHIEKDIENEECEEIFKNECKQRTKKLKENIERCFNECEEQFRKGIQKTIEEFEERIKDSLVMLNHINLDSGFDPNFNIHSGINMLNTLGLLSSIASLVFGIFNFWNPVGWASIGLGLVGICKSVWCFFDSDYKKSQQRKEVDKILNKNCEIIEEKMRNQLKSCKKNHV